MNMKLYFILFASLIFKTTVFSNEVYIGSDLSESLASLYDYNPKIKYEREILKSKDELLPRAFSNFRPEISGYYQKGKIDTISKGFNITSDGIRTETNKGVTEVYILLGTYLLVLQLVNSMRRNIVLIYDVYSYIVLLQFR